MSDCLVGVGRGGGGGVSEEGRENLGLTDLRFWFGGRQWGGWVGFDGDRNV